MTLYYFNIFIPIRNAKVVFFLKQSNTSRKNILNKATDRGKPTERHPIGNFQHPIRNYLFRSMSLISVKRLSSFVGAGASSGTTSSLRFKEFNPFITIKIQSAIIVN